ncbi:mannose-6-phosphate isomerase [[Haemophilus] ducreyi]|nr:mannose-6-phosphate isomerase, type 1 [[Haemophilus] ducreyi]VEG82987.1 mannose-6-phosphate isomerase [[Haemophilus] ducreyi]
MIFQLKGKFQHYPWGGRYFIPHFLKLTEVVDQPYAEYWLGAHPAASATIKFGEQWLSLADVIKQAPELLGERSRQQFGDNLPYLLKILDIKQPLSIQLHPNKAQAEYGFNQENRQGIPLEDVRRIYKDRNHKPEMMIALSDFWLLHGFKSITAIQACLAKYPSTSALAKSLVEKSLAVVYAEIMHADQAQLASWIRPIIEQRREDYLADKLKLSDPDYWLLYMTDDLAADAPLDAGLMCFYLFNIVHLKKGEGIYQAANLPHAYLRGQSIELMANSDNVIRGGLTTKWVDIPALLQCG